MTGEQLSFFVTSPADLGAMDLIACEALRLGLEVERLDREKRGLEARVHALEVMLATFSHAVQDEVATRPRRWIDDSGRMYIVRDLSLANRKAS